MSTKALYVHIPFCDHICGYCDFTRFLYNRRLSDALIIKLIQEINQLPAGLTTIYVGGGTPTSLHDDQLEALLQALKPKCAADYEWTFEGNPENLSEAKVALLVQYGVNRMSLGVQTSDDNLLKDIGRHHRFYDVGKGVDMLRKQGIDNLSLDLMYGLPNQSLDSFQASMNDILQLAPNHVSIYALTVEPNSVFGRKGIQSVSSDVETDMYLACIDTMTSHGYEHYEISNFCLPGFRSQHNQVYWRYEDFYALGPGSSMKINNVRRKWTTNLRKYLAGNVYDEDIHLSTKESMFEFVMMGLRLKDGIAFARFFDRFGVAISDVYGSAIQRCVDQELLIKDSRKIVTTRAGFIMLDDVLMHFMD